MRAGQLRHRVTLRSPVATQDAAGQPSTAWLDVATDIAADVRHLSGTAAIKAGADVSTTQASIRVRRRAISPDQRVVHGGTVFEILSVLPDARRQFVDMVCEVINGASNA